MVLRLVVGVVGGQRAQADGGEQALLHDLQHRLPAAAVEHRMAERDGEYLVRPAARIFAMLAVDHIVEVAAFGIPEPGIEGRRAASAICDSGGDRARVLQLPHPLRQQLQRVVPKRVDLDRLAAPGRDHPVADLGVHPGELVASAPCRSRPSCGSTAMPKRVPSRWCSTTSISLGSSSRSVSRSPVSST